MKSLITAEQLINSLHSSYLVDVRSPGEYAQSCIPGAVNIPLFNDEERAQVGAAYWREGTDRAKLVGLSLVSPRLNALVESILQGAAGRKIVLYCWRGGLRSRSLFSVMETLGYPVAQLAGGYKAFRRSVVNYLQNAEISVPVFVLNGLTGVGKTGVIRIMQAQNIPALDLEGMANHRGSAFGAVGLGKTRSQKDFEALLCLSLRKHKDEPFLILEGEGRRIGSVRLPDFIYSAIQNGRHILLEAALETRVERICEEYCKNGADQTDNLLQAVSSLKKQLGEKKAADIARLIISGDHPGAVRTLCADYYDLRYHDSRQSRANYLAAVDASDLKSAAGAVLDAVRRAAQTGEDRLMKGETP